MVFRLTQVSSQDFSTSQLRERTIRPSWEALRILYESDPDILSNRSVVGVKARTRNINGSIKVYPAKPALTPEKLNAVRSQYYMRIQSNCVDSVDFTKRISDVYFKKLLSNALSNEGRAERYELYDVVLGWARKT